jgi:hypothetical protein
VAYNKQKETALGLAPGTLVKTSEEGNQQVATTSIQQQLAAANLYRDANSMLYADNKPSEEAIDRVVAKINKECVVPFLTSHSSFIIPVAWTNATPSHVNETPTLIQS